MTCLLLHDVTVTHGRRPAVHHLSGEFAPGSLTAIVGPNGAGKTTLLRAIAGLHPLANGRIEGARDVAILPQGSALDRTFPLACLDVVALGEARQAGPFSSIGTTRAHAALAAVGLVGFERRPVGSLSAGQFQRVLFARLMVQDAPVLLLDEPFNAVDARTEADLLAVLHNWHLAGRTIIAVLHDLDLVRAHFPADAVAGPARRWVGAHCRRLASKGSLLKARLVAEAWSDDAAPCRQAA